MLSAVKISKDRLKEKYVGCRAILWVDYDNKHEGVLMEGPKSRNLFVRQSKLEDSLAGGFHPDIPVCSGYDIEVPDPRHPARDGKSGSMKQYCVM